MGLKAILESLDGIAEPLREFYKKSDDGKFILEAEGLVPKNKLDEFRENNIRLLKEREDSEKSMAKYKDIDLDEYLAMKEEKRKLADKKLIDSGKIDELVEQRVTEMRNKYENEIKTRDEKLSNVSSRLEKTLIDSELARAAAEAGVVETAVDDVIYRGRQVFRLKNDQVLPMLGDNVIFGTDGTTPISMKEWLGQLAVKAPHLFKQSTGAGASNSQGNGSGFGSVTKKSDLKNPKEKSEFISKHGVDKYLGLPA